MPRSPRVTLVGFKMWYALCIPPSHIDMLYVDVPAFWGAISVLFGRLCVHSVPEPYMTGNL